MNWSEIPLVDYIQLHDEQCDVYIHTKDQRVIGLRDVRTNAHLDNTGFYVDHMAMGLKFSFFLPREDFSHIEYRYIPRDKISKKEFDDLNSFIEEQFEDYKYPSESLTDPEEGLFEDLI